MTNAITLNAQRSAQIGKAIRRLTGQQDRNGVRALTNLENVNSVWERGAALPFPLCVTKTALSRSSFLSSRSGCGAPQGGAAV